MTIQPADQVATDTGRRVGRAFGLDLEIGFPCPGLPEHRVDTAAAAERIRIDVVDPRELEPMPFDGDELYVKRDADGTIAVRLTASPDGSYRFSTVVYGDFEITAGGARVECAPPPGEAWRWQRFLVGQVLPLLAVLHGYEVFHASAVRWGNRTIAFTGPSRGGKSSLATALMLRGARLVTDDVMVVDPLVDAETLAIHPAFGLLSVRHDAAVRLGPESVSRLGQRVGADDDAVRLLVEVEPFPPPVSDLFVLERSPMGGGPLIEPLHHVDPRVLLAAGYNYSIRTPERLVRHLDVCARLARTTCLHRIAITSNVGPEEVAAAVADRVIAEL